MYIKIEKEVGAFVKTNNICMLPNEIYRSTCIYYT